MHHSLAATADLIKRTANSTNYIYCLQEPYVAGGRLAKFPARLKPLHGPGHPRAAIWGSRDANLWLVPKFSSGDISTCIWRTPGKASTDIHVASVYLDITRNGENFFPKEFVALVRHCSGRNLPLIVCMDSNAHSTLWAKDENGRGRILEEFIFDHGLTVENVGTKPTFEARGTETTIDITLSLNLDEILDWRVSDVSTLSDHRQIEFEVEVKSKEPPKVVYNLAKADWDLFRKEMSQRQANGPLSPICWTPSTINEEASAITNDISLSVTQSCPKIGLRGTHGKGSDWTPDIVEARKRAKALQRAARRHQTNEARMAYILAKLHFRSLYRKAGNSSWQNFASETKDFRGAARLFKTTQGEMAKTLGLLTKSDGSTTEGPEDTLNLLMDTHFPGSVSARDSQESQAGIGIRDADLEGDEVSFITVHKVRAAMATFGAQKAAGPDGIKPIILHQLGDDTLGRITRLFKASLLLGHTPILWRTSKVVFIPKIGKDDYGQPKSFRPISLTSFLFKTLERVILWELEETSLRDYPMSRNQHAFRKGSGTESALSDMVNQIERAILRGEHAMGVFLDIQGAFDNLPTPAAIKGMRNHHISPLIVDWYSQYLRNRIATAEVKGQSVTRHLTRGTPQGGVLSPLVWNLSFDSLLNLFGDAVDIKGFADDAALVICGKFLPIMQQLMQEAVNRATKWGRENGLTFGPTKTQAVIFTRKRKIDAIPQLKVAGTDIPYSTSAKYLGITLDSELNFKLHLNEKTKKAKQLLCKYRKSVGRLWGPSPIIQRWVYTGIVRPMMTYGALVWGQHAGRKSLILPFRRIQALAVHSMTHVRRSAPHQGLEILCHLMPFDLFVKGEAAMGSLRIRHRNPERWDGRGDNQLGHLRWARDVLEEAKVGNLVLDRAEQRFNWEKTYEVVQDSFDRGDPIDVPDISVASDGSKIDQKTGWGYEIRRADSVIASDQGSLGPLATVFQGEVTAIFQASEKLYNEDFTSAFFFVDSQAALRALDKKVTTSKTVEECVRSLNRLGRKSQVYLRWVKAHVGHDHNEAADQLAKAGATADLGSHTLPVSRKVLKGLIDEYLIKQWTQRWETYTEALETKYWFPQPNKSAAMGLLRGVDRALYCKVVQAITGHCYLNYHHNVRVSNLPAETAKCRFCGASKETPKHLVSECDALWREVSGSFLVSHLHNVCPVWKPDQLLRFLREPSMESLWHLRGIE